MCGGLLCFTSGAVLAETSTVVLQKGEPSYAATSVSLRKSNFEINPIGPFLGHIGMSYSHDVSEQAAIGITASFTQAKFDKNKVEGSSVGVLMTRKLIDFGPIFDKFPLVRGNEDYPFIQGAITSPDFDSFKIQNQ